MSDAQFTILISALITIAGTIAAAIRWSITRITRSIDGTHDVVKDNTEALILNTKSNSRLEVKIDSVAAFVERHTPLGTKKKARTAPHGIAVVPDPDEET